MINRIKKDLDNLYKENPKRLNHIYGVYETATKLGELHHLNIEKLQIAALLHDITKYYTFEENKRIIQENFQNHNEILEEFDPKILHSYSAYIIAKQKYNIKDVDILNSILYHTIGKKNMTPYEQIIFISDYIEPNRTYESCKIVRDIAFKDINQATFKAIDFYITYHESKNLKIPKQAYLAHAYYKQEVQNG